MAYFIAPISLCIYLVGVHKLIISGKKIFLQSDGTASEMGRFYIDNSNRKDNCFAPCKLGCSPKTFLMQANKKCSSLKINSYKLSTNSGYLLDGCFQFSKDV